MTDLSNAFDAFNGVDTSFLDGDADRLGMVEISEIDVLEQIRGEMDGEESTLDELAQDIKKNGVISPVLICPLDNGRFRLVAGERRLLGAMRAGFTRIPALMRNLTDLQIAEVQLSENIHRKNLTMLELAKRLEADMAKFNSDMTLVCAAWGKSRAWVSKMTQVAKAPPSVKALVAAGVTTDVDTVAAVAGQANKDAKKGLANDPAATSNKMMAALKTNAAKPKRDQASPRSVVSDVQREAKGKGPKAATKTKSPKVVDPLDQDLEDPYTDSPELAAAKAATGKGSGNGGSGDAKGEKKFGNVPFASSSTGGDKQVAINDIVADLGRHFSGLEIGIKDLLEMGRASESARGDLIGRLEKLVKLAQG